MGIRCTRFWNYVELFWNSLDNAPFSIVFYLEMKLEVEVGVQDTAVHPSCIIMFVLLFFHLLCIFIIVNKHPIIIIIIIIKYAMSLEC